MWQVSLSGDLKRAYVNLYCIVLRICNVYTSVYRGSIPTYIKSLFVQRMSETCLVRNCMKFKGTLQVSKPYQYAYVSAELGKQHDLKLKASLRALDELSGYDVMTKTCEVKTQQPRKS